MKIKKTTERDDPLNHYAKALQQAGISNPLASALVSPGVNGLDNHGALMPVIISGSQLSLSSLDSPQKS